MINIRFHVVSLVAVFLALGIGVAMGASFIDRATVSSMQDRVDDLETGFRDRGSRLERYGDFLRGSDEAAASLSAPGSRATAGALADVPVVLVAPAGLPEDAVGLLTEVLADASAQVVGTVALQASIAEATDDSNAGSAVEPTDALAAALAALSANPPTPEGPGAGTPEPGTSEPGDPQPDTGGPLTPDPPGEALGAGAQAVAAIEDLADRGLIALDAAGQPAETAFPATAGVRYVLLLAADTSPPPEGWLVSFVETYGELSASTMLVAGVAGSRPAGDLPSSSEGDDLEVPTPLAELLEPIRTGAASNEVSSVQFATEPLARLAVVYGVQALTEDIVGHYGLGEGVDTPYPAVAEE